MSKEAKKKPGELAAARRRHLRRQEIQDAISAVRRGETVTLWWPDKSAPNKGKFFRLSPAPDSWWDNPRGDALVRVNGSRLVIGWIVDKDGTKCCADSLGSFHVHDQKQVLALAEQLPDDQAQSPSDS